MPDKQAGSRDGLQPSQDLADAGGDLIGALSARSPVTEQVPAGTAFVAVVVALGSMMVKRNEFIAAGLALVAVSLARAYGF